MAIFYMEVLSNGFSEVIFVSSRLSKVLETQYDSRAGGVKLLDLRCFTFFKKSHELSLSTSLQVLLRLRNAFPLLSYGFR